MRGSLSAASRFGARHAAHALALVVLIAPAQGESLEEYAETCNRIVGVDVPAFNCDVGTLVEDKNYKGESCDRPNQLHQKCDRASRFQVLVKNDDAVIVVHCRKRRVEDKGYYDIALIQYSPKNGAACFYQALDEKNSLLRSAIDPPVKGMGGFWESPLETAKIGCAGCHDNGVFLRSPYLAQVKGKDKLPGAGDDTYNHDEPYCFVGKDFSEWKTFSVEVEGNKCLTCHRLGVSNVIRGEKGTGQDFALRATAAFQINKNEHSQTSPLWMPPGTWKFDQANYDAALQIAKCARRYSPSGILPNDKVCKIVRFSFNADSCLVGDWEATSISNEDGSISTDHGTGFRVSFACDGTQTVDYEKMKPFLYYNPVDKTYDKIAYTGKASVRISTSENEAKLETAVDGNVKMTLTTSVWPDPIVSNLAPFLGPGGLGDTVDDNSYTCERAKDGTRTVKYHGTRRLDRHANFSVTLEPVKK